MSRDIRQLTGLRGVLALDVVLGHYDTMKLPGMDRILFGNVAVDFFFCLSGFMLSVVYGLGVERRLDWAGYAGARFARIYPVYLLSLVLMLGLTVGAEEPGRIAREFTTQAALLGALPIPATAGFWAMPCWSVSVELLCYVLVLPVLFRASRLAVRLPAPVLAAVAVAATASDFLFFRGFFDPTVLGLGFPPPHDPAAWWVASVRGTAMFVCGWSVQLARRADRRAPIALGRMTDVAALLFAAGVALGPTDPGSRQMLVFVAPLLVGGLACDGSMTARLLAWTPVHYLGRISYSLYLLHVPVQLALMRDPWMSRHPDVMYPGALAAAVGVAAVSCEMFEMPARRALRAWLGGTGRLSLRTQ